MSCEEDFCLGFLGEDGLDSLGLEASYLSESLEGGGTSGASSSTETYVSSGGYSSLSSRR